MLVCITNAFDPYCNQTLNVYNIKKCYKGYIYNTNFKKNKEYSLLQKKALQTNKGIFFLY